MSAFADTMDGDGSQNDLEIKDPLVKQLDDGSYVTIWDISRILRSGSTMKIRVSFPDSERKRLVTVREEKL